MHKVAKEKSSIVVLRRYAFLLDNDWFGKFSTSFTTDELIGEVNAATYKGESLSIDHTGMFLAKKTYEILWKTFIHGRCAIKQNY